MVDDNQHARDDRYDGHDDRDRLAEPACVEAQEPVRAAEQHNQAVDHQEYPEQDRENVGDEVRHDQEYDADDERDRAGDDRAGDQVHDSENDHERAAHHDQDVQGLSLKDYADDSEQDQQDPRQQKAERGAPDDVARSDQFRFHAASIGKVV